MDVASLSRHRVTFSRPSDGPTGYDIVSTGEPASIKFMSPGSPEVIRFGMPATWSGFLIRIRYREDVRADWRIEDEIGRVFHVSSYGDREDKRRELQLWCSQLQ